MHLVNLLPRRRHIQCGVDTDNDENEMEMDSDVGDEESRNKPIVDYNQTVSFVQFAA